MKWVSLAPVAPFGATQFSLPTDCAQYTVLLRLNTAFFQFVTVWIQSTSYCSLQQSTWICVLETSGRGG